MDVLSAELLSNFSANQHAEPTATVPRPKLWQPKRVLVTPAALEWEHGHAMLARAEALGCEVVRLKANRLVWTCSEKMESL